MSRDPRVDSYIAKAQPFAQPIMHHLRAVVHEACPEVEETIKWGMPSFMHHGILAGMAAFKAHVAFGFWKGRLVTGDAARSREAMWSFGRITSLDDLPKKRQLLAMVKKAAKLNEAGATAPRTVKHAKPVLRLPADLATALKAKPAAKAFYATLPPSAKRDYVEWITEAKQPATRAKRVAQAVQWLGEGKRRNWKYETR
ncbi:YdeI/OmpD-associated family protein [Pseudogemmatithrix spongiicola]|uniref:YdeI/OmpD-associated family protein n=1 Tax=Pseudogemmatithrix spongiicola TaxID=3062599 RepID=A0AA49JSB8_9BACT|nr:YdeI/OmpD-associated family protein [Gemmatimonadaceae bacterium 'strain 138']WKW13981.1 YdeI/OmpD-associated family protein [Gemmatimonadaceae bacterium 'strain 318']